MEYWKYGASQMALVVKNLPANAGVVRDVGLILELGRFPERGYSNSLQYSCLENPMDRGAWRDTAHGVSKRQTRLNRLSTCAGTQAPKKCLLGEQLNGDSPMVPGSQQRPVLVLKL